MRLIRIPKNSGFKKQRPNFLSLYPHLARNGSHQVTSPSEPTPPTWLRATYPFRLPPPRSLPRFSLMPMTICVIVPGLGGYPSFRGFRATQYTYPPAPINPDPESTRQLQQLLSKGGCSGEVWALGLSMGAGLAGETASGGAATLSGSRGWDMKEPMLLNSTSMVGALKSN